MRPTPWIAAEPYRVTEGIQASRYGEPFGCFMIPHNRTAVVLACIVSDGDYKDAGLPKDYAWEHVSVSCRNRTPNWYEMDFIKDIFWLETETVIQLHVPKALHKNAHPHVLHLWRPLHYQILLPPSDTVAP